MNFYTPEHVDMRQCDPTYQPYEAYLPSIPDPLDVEGPATETDAAEQVGTYLYRASGDPGTKELQWHACQIQIHPWSIKQGTFERLVDELPEWFPHFDHELAAEVWLSDVAFSLDKKEDQP